MFSDKSIACVDCGTEFVFTAREQEFYKEKGFANEPKRCPACRSARKQGGGREGGGGQGGGSATGGKREMFPAVCAGCGKETTVPFKPVGTRPVYCSDCFRQQRGSRY